jgi:hypothetical protein
MSVKVMSDQVSITTIADLTLRELWAILRKTLLKSVGYGVAFGVAYALIHGVGRLGDEATIIGLDSVVATWNYLPRWSKVGLAVFLLAGLVPKFTAGVLEGLAEDLFKVAGWLKSTRAAYRLLLCALFSCSQLSQRRCRSSECSFCLSLLRRPNHFAKSSRNESALWQPANLGVKLSRPGFGPAAELPTSSPA